MNKKLVMAITLISLLLLAAPINGSKSYKLANLTQGKDKVTSLYIMEQGKYAVNYQISLNDIYNTSAHPTLADIDNDGKLELIVIKNSSLYTLKYNNATSFNVIWMQDVGNVSTSPITADFNGDSQLEIFVINDTGYVWYFSANGSALSNFDTGITEIKQATLFDINGDGKQEIILKVKKNIYYITFDGRYGKFNVPLELGSYILSSKLMVFDDNNDTVLSLLAIFYQETTNFLRVASFNSSSINWINLHGNITGNLEGNVFLEPIIGNFTIDTNDLPYQNPYEMVLFTSNKTIVMLSITRITPFIEAQTSLNFTLSKIQPLGGDVNSDGLDEIVVVDVNGTIHLLNETSEIWNVTIGNVTKLLAISEFSSSTGLETIVNLTNNSILVIGSNGSIIAKYPSTWGETKFVLLGDIDGDAKNEMIIFGSNSTAIIHGDAQGIGWYTEDHNLYRTRNPSTPLDSDYDGLPDTLETIYGTNKTDGDTDDDMSIDYTEVAIWHTNPLLNDTDGDNLTDGWEIFYKVNYRANLDPLSNDTNNNTITDNLEDLDNDNLTNYEEMMYNTNPMLNDTDGDGLTDWEEINVTKTNPANEDTDGDGMPDGWELEKGFDPRNATDGSLDPDGDGLINSLEYKHSTDPFDPDTDRDGMSDGYEIKYGLNPKDPKDALEDLDKDGISNGLEASYGTDPKLNDTDGDGMPDGWEISFSLNPLDPIDNETDVDGDGLTNIEEYKLGTSPISIDSDNDGMPDGWEVKYDLDPTKAVDSTYDLDGDGLSNKDEYTYGTDPRKADTDGDGLPDGSEVLWGSSPVKNDTDGDGLNDFIEYSIGTDPRNVDTDGDGVSDYEEYLRGTNPLDPYNGAGYLYLYAIMTITSIVIIALVYYKKIEI